MSTFKLADGALVKSYISIMFDGLKITPMPDVTLPEDGYVGTYIDSDGALVALTTCDLNISAYTACALTMFPANAAKEAINAGSLDEALKDNLYELMNIYSRFFMDDHTPHLKLDKVFSLSELGDEARELLASDAAKTTLKFELPDYGEGLVTFIAK